MACCIVELSPAERFAIYDYTVARAKAANKTPSIKLADLQINFEKKDNDQEHPPSELEIKSKMRDYKRRRQSYRAKNVHITRKSYTEVLREVIENQADYLRHMLKEDDESIAVSESLSKLGSWLARGITSRLRGQKSLGIPRPDSITERQLSSPSMT
ncbi:U11/U12 small nuclear ribonucleoprotein 48 kDa protein isoform X3 [Ixodes scapularis]